MKAAVIYRQGELPQYTGFPEPVVANSGEILVTVKAVAIKHFDKGRAVGKHYSGEAPKENGRVIDCHKTGEYYCIVGPGSAKRAPSGSNDMNRYCS